MYIAKRTINEIHAFFVLPQSLAHLGDSILFKYTQLFSYH